MVSFDWGVLHGQGTWQQYRVVPEATLVAVPASVSDTSAAQATINPVAVAAFLQVTKSNLAVDPGDEGQPRVMPLATQVHVFWWCEPCARHLI